jgi:hypothetical protein
VLVTTDPTAARPTWSPSKIDYYQLGAISCVSTSFCAAVDSAGNAVIGHPLSPIPTPPSPAQITGSLRRQITPHGNAARISSLLKKRIYRVSFTALTGGKVGIDWYYQPKRTHRARTKPNLVLVAAGTRTFTTARTQTVPIKLTKTGERLLRNATRLKLTAAGAFIPSDEPAVEATREFSLTHK